MDGMVTFAGGRPVIVLTKKASADWQLFVLAHEIGHIACHHLSFDDGEAILDETIDSDPSNDINEQEANHFALQVITPHGLGLRIEDRVPKAPELAVDALRFGREHGIHPGHVILSAVRHTTIDGKQLWPLGNAALKHLPPEVASRPVEDLCREALNRHVDITKLRDDSTEFLEKLGVL